MKKVCGCVNSKPIKKMGVNSKDGSADEFANWWERRPESEIWQARVGIIDILAKIYLSRGGTNFNQFAGREKRKWK